jgi:hypothetical protein
MHHYESVHECLPPARVSPTGASWAVVILPYLEQENLHREWSLNQSYYHQSPTARLTAVKIYFCPSRRTAQDSPQRSLSGDVITVNGTDTHVPGALCDYAVSIGLADL